MAPIIYEWQLAIEIILCLIFSVVIKVWQEFRWDLTLVGSLSRINQGSWHGTITVRLCSHPGKSKNLPTRNKENGSPNTTNKQAKTGLACLNVRTWISMLSRSHRRTAHHKSQKILLSFISQFKIIGTISVWDKMQMEILIRPLRARLTLSAYTALLKLQRITLSKYTRVRGPKTLAVLNTSLNAGADRRLTV